MGKCHGHVAPLNRLIVHAGLGVLQKPVIVVDCAIASFTKIHKSLYGQAQDHVQAWRIHRQPENHLNHIAVQAARQLNGPFVGKLYGGMPGRLIATKATLLDEVRLKTIFLRGFIFMRSHAHLLFADGWCRLDLPRMHATMPSSFENALGKKARVVSWTFVCVKNLKKFRYLRDGTRAFTEKK